LVKDGLGSSSIVDISSEIEENPVMDVVGDFSKARIIAFFIDNLIAIGIMFVIVALVPEGLPLMKGVAIVFMYLGYFVVLEAVWSRTIGKYFQGLVVRKLDGTSCDWTSALIRSVLRIVEVNPVLFGGFPAGLVVMSSARKQRLGDMLAGTIVVSDKLSWQAPTEPASTE
jgi:uncharacterized RDD family membrane protein YckC